MALFHVQLRVFLLLQFLQQLPPLRVKLPAAPVDLPIADPGLAAPAQAGTPVFGALLAAPEAADESFAARLRADPKTGTAPAARLKCLVDAAQTLRGRARKRRKAVACQFKRAEGLDGSVVDRMCPARNVPSVVEQEIQLIADRRKLPGQIARAENTVLIEIVPRLFRAVRAEEGLG